MTDFDRPDKFPAGTSVGAYPVSNWPAPERDHPSGAPVGAATDTDTVAADGTFSLTLTAGAYWVTGSVGGEYPYVRFVEGQTHGADAVEIDDTTPVDVAVADPLPAGTNAIGKLAANSGVDIGDVDVTSQPARDAATDSVTAASEKTATADEGSGAVSVGSSTTEIVAANADRIKVIIVNDSDETIYLGYGEDAVMNQGVRINANGGSIVESSWAGAIDGICSSGSKVATFIEF